jgi:hypothetical protein
MHSNKNMLIYPIPDIGLSNSFHDLIKNKPIINEIIKVYFTFLCPTHTNLLFTKLGSVKEAVPTGFPPVP